MNEPLNHESPIEYKLMAAVFTGIVGSILVIFGVQFTDLVVVDFRYIAIIVAAIHGGPTAALLGGLLISLFRMFYVGVTYASVTGAVFVITAAAGCGIISKLKRIRRTKWVQMILFCELNSLFALHAVIPGYNDLWRIFIPYSISFLIISSLVYYYSESIAVTNGLIRKLKKESTKDFLTGLNNVRNFDMCYNAALKNAEEKSEELSVVVVDIDHFKKVNDTYGHQAGDAVLKQLGYILKKGCREFDIVSRNGGEEFSMILLDCPGDKASEIAERIRSKVESAKFILPDGRAINITVSLGIATYPETAKDNESLYKNADKALYMAKNTGRNKVCYFDSNNNINCN